MVALPTCHQSHGESAGAATVAQPAARVVVPVSAGAARVGITIRKVEDVPCTPARVTVKPLHTILGQDSDDWAMKPATDMPEQPTHNAGFWSHFVDVRRPFDIEGIPVWLYALNAVLAVAILALGQLPVAGVAGAFSVLWTI